MKRRETAMTQEPHICVFRADEQHQTDLDYKPEPMKTGRKKRTIFELRTFDDFIISRSLLIVIMH